MNKRINTVIQTLRFSVFSLLLSVSHFARAQGNGPQGGGNAPTSLSNPLQVDSVNEFLLLVLQGVQTLLYPIIVIAVMYAGFLFITAQGNPEKIRKAKFTLMWVLIGAGIILGARILAEVVQETLTGLGEGI